ncbi:MAG: S-adenosylmethionine:tRNA ribosyltransferase-isomerase, partial [Acidobacteriota bacterium]
IREHHLLPEAYEIRPRVAAAIARARRRGGRVVAVGTTVTRALEASATGQGGLIRPGRGRCDLFIYPGYRFRIVDCLLTNFHLPRTTLIMLVCALAGREALLASYAEAVRRQYRFYSYGDAMLIH